MQIKGNLIRLFKRQCGVAMTELLVSLPALLLMGLGSLQTALLFDAKIIINSATFEAARKGAVNHAQSDAMRQELGLRLASLFGGDGSAERAMSAITRASLDVQDSRFTEIEIINPTIEAFDEFGRNIVDPRSGDAHFGIPNSHLRWRDPEPGSSGVNIQDANLLKIKVTYGYQLKVPLMDRVIPAVMQFFDPDNFTYYNARRLPITSVATVRMQSDAWRDENNVHMEPPGSGGTPPSAEDDSESSGATPTDEAGQGGDDEEMDDRADTEDTEDTNPPSSGDTQAGDNSDNSDGDDLPPISDNDDLPPISDGDDLPSISDGDDHGPAICEIPETPEDETFSPTSQTSGIAGSHEGNPIHVVTGNKYQQEPDLSPLPGSLGLLFKRHYNSHSKYKGPLGYGWSHSYDLSLQSEGEGYRLRQSDGRVIHFQPTESTDMFTAPRISDGWLRVNEQQLTWHWRDGRQLQFSPTGQLQRLVLANGQTLSLFYNPQGKLFLVRDPQGRELSMDHYPNGRLKAMYDPSGKATRYRYDEVGNLQQVTSHDGATRVYHYTDPHDSHNLTGITDERGVRYATWAYDAKDRAILSTHADQVGQIKLDFSTPGETKVTDSQGKVSTYKTEIRNGVALVTAIHGPGCTSCGQGNISYRYNEGYQIIAKTNSEGTTLHYTRDERGRVTALTKSVDGKEQRVASIKYLAERDLPIEISVPSVKSGADFVREIDYNAQGSPEKVQESGFTPLPEGGFKPITRAVQLDYDSKAQMHAIDGVLSQIEGITQIERDSLGRMKTITNHDGTTQQVSYNAYGKIDEIVFDREHPVTVSYTADLAIASIESQAGTFSYEYDAAGNPLRYTTPDGTELHMEYDPAGRMIKRYNDRLETRFKWTEDNRIEQKSWHVEGRPVSTLNYLYDDQKRLLALKNQSGEIVRQFEYEAGKKLPRSIQAPGKLTTIEYDDFGKLKRLKTSDGLVRRYASESHGKLIAVTNARGNTTRYRYDDFGRVIFTQSPDKGLITYQYDEKDRLIAKTDAAGQRVGFTYNTVGKLAKVRYPDEEVTLTYGQGQLQSLNRHKGHEQWQYDPSGRMTVYTRTYAEHEYTTRYWYDEAGRLEKVGLPGGKKLKYRQDLAKDEMNLSLDGWFRDTDILTIEENSNGSRQMRFGNDVITTYRFNGAKLNSLHTEGIYDYRYQYNDSGAIIGIDDGEQAYARYRYDDAGRLDFAMMPFGLYGYRYDENGNRTEKIVNGTHMHYRYADHSNHIRKASLNSHAIPMVHDSRGNIHQSADAKIGYTANGQPEHISVADKLIASYSYNSRAERTSKTVYGEAGPVTTHYLYENKRLIAEMDEQGEIVRQYLYLGWQPVALLEGGEIYTIHSNHLSAPVAVSDAKGRLVWRAHYAPFGRAHIEDDPDGDQVAFQLNLRLPGQYEDTETGLHYNYYRYYDPETGRYLSSDPLDLNAGMNTYAYAANDPVQNIDPTGLLLFAFDGTGNTNNRNVLNDPDSPGDISNVVRFAESYRSAPGELPATPYIDWDGSTASSRDFYYITGAGVDDPNFGSAPSPDAALGVSLQQRVAHMADYLVQYIEQMEDQGATDPVEIDIVGFSRGAAEARMFANVVDDIIRVAQSGADFSDPTAAEELRYIYENLRREQDPFIDTDTGSAIDADMNRLRAALDYLNRDCNARIDLNLNFIGLFDTVPHYGVLQSNDLQQLRLGIPASADHAAHAVAANEHRSDFAGVSIHDSPATANSATRIERGFIGAHSDIGGGYAEGDLSDVAFMWMVQQAESAGVEMDRSYISGIDWDVVTNPIVHDSVDVCPSSLHCFSGPDRTFMYANSSDIVNQQTWSGAAGDDSMDYAESQPLFDEQFMEDVPCGVSGYSTCREKGVGEGGDRTKVGAIILEDVSNPTEAIDTYNEWLSVHYGLDLDINHSDLRQ
ncbi:phospholipase effector Tle1 domain-containing protein [Candidatus Thiodiazotropha sp. CDECU1]|uniref:phospholipase effector Tle1 domain-containing protein n=1 Tax=Candidatus Thiodiazotropha sp. CDECU1 TaxID=3065865 RepID=UPI00292D3939|nr:DUF2235 domain-containing protein [Candidatus Thiodiazotropha sp. CDECU1]